MRRLVGLDQQSFVTRINQCHEAESKEACDHNIWQEQDESGDKASPRKEQHSFSPVIRRISRQLMRDRLRQTSRRRLEEQEDKHQAAERYTIPAETRETMTGNKCDQPANRGNRCHEGNHKAGCQ